MMMDDPALVEVDYPVGGLDSPGWQRIAPGKPTDWRAFRLTSRAGESHGLFLGVGNTTLIELDLALGEWQLMVLGGCVYGWHGASEATCFPTRYLGYSNLWQDERRLIFSNFAELLLIERSPGYRHLDQAAVDDLEVLGAIESGIQVRGMRRLGEDITNWEIAWRDLPIHAIRSEP